jgi:phenylalanyl-tRNA synthetase beta chain
MKVTLNWLKEYVDFDWSPDELTERLTMVGVEVEGVDKISGAFEGIVVAEVLEKGQHPNADKLSLCKVNDGAEERQIVCGATNFKAGDKIPLAKPGTWIPRSLKGEGFTLEVGKIRGVKSMGMMCSSFELGVSEDAEGLLILPEDAPVGQAYGLFVGKAGGDVVYDLEITPNRPDLNSVIGIAREIAALTGNPLKLPAAGTPRDGGTASDSETTNVNDLVAGRIEDAELCPRYTARVITGVKVGPSPDWLRDKLEKIGLRSINNVVDVTNFVMMEIGQPLHAFDYHLLDKKESKPTIVVRRAAAGEKFTTLDEKEHELNPDILVIADESKALALAGVMGGLNSEIQNDTKDVLIESAYFDPRNIRATSKRLALSTDSSYRFERGCDLEIADWASQRAAQLILETAGGQLAEGLIDAYPAKHETREVTLRHAKCDQLLGVTIAPAEQIKMLQGLELELTGQDGETSASFRVPSFRVDIKREIDLIEEVCRVYGVDKIPSTPPRGATGSNTYDASHDELAHCRGILCGLGLNEAQGQTLISEASAQLAADDYIPLLYPLSQDMNVVRPSLLPGLLDILKHNLNHKNANVALFEIGRTFSPGEASTNEQRSLAIALTGDRDSESWKSGEETGKCDILDLKGALEAFFERLGLRGFNFNRRDEETNLFVESATLQLGKHSLGQIGQLKPLLARDYDLRDPVFLAELNLDKLLSLGRAAKSFKQLAKHPTIRRDIAMLVDDSTTHDDVTRTIKKTKPDHLESVEIFDVYRGEGIPDGKKSVAYALTFRHEERSLKDKEADKAHAKVVEALKSKLGAEIR